MGLFTKLVWFWCPLSNSLAIAEPPSPNLTLRENIISPHLIRKSSDFRTPIAKYTRLDCLV